MAAEEAAKRTGSSTQAIAGTPGGSQVRNSQRTRSSSSKNDTARTGVRPHQPSTNTESSKSVANTSKSPSQPSDASGTTPDKDTLGSGWQNLMKGEKLSPAERNKLLMAGGAAFVGQRALLGKENRII